MMALRSILSKRKLLENLKWAIARYYGTKSKASKYFNF